MVDPRSLVNHSLLVAPPTMEELIKVRLLSQAVTRSLNEADFADYGFQHWKPPLTVTIGEHLEHLGVSI